MSQSVNHRSSSCSETLARGRRFDICTTSRRENESLAPSVAIVSQKRTIRRLQLDSRPSASLKSIIRQLARSVRALVAVLFVCIVPSFDGKLSSERKFPGFKFNCGVTFDPLRRSINPIPFILARALSLSLCSFELDGAPAWKFRLVYVAEMRGRISGVTRTTLFRLPHRLRINESSRSSIHVLRAVRLSGAHPNRYRNTQRPAYRTLDDLYLRRTATLSDCFLKIVYLCLYAFRPTVPTYTIR